MILVSQAESSGEYVIFLGLMLRIFDTLRPAQERANPKRPWQLEPMSAWQGGCTQALDIDTHHTRGTEEMSANQHLFQGGS